jgi:hydroxyacylglutathione hydrolase
LYAVTVCGSSEPTEEVKHNPIRRANHIHLSQVPECMNEVPRDRSVHIFCGSARRATVAASLLRRAGRDNLTVVLGGPAAGVR